MPPHTYGSSCLVISIPYGIVYIGYPLFYILISGYRRLAAHTNFQKGEGGRPVTVSFGPISLADLHIHALPLHTNRAPLITPYVSDSLPCSPYAMPYEGPPSYPIGYPFKP